MAENYQERIVALFRKRVEAELLEIDALIEDNAQNAAPVTLDQQSVGRLARMGAMQVQAMAQSAERRRRGRKQALLHALRRMEEGEYGYCAECGDEIGEGRLGVDPAFHLCVRCAR